MRLLGLNGIAEAHVTCKFRTGLHENWAGMQGTMKNSGMSRDSSGMFAWYVLYRFWHETVHLGLYRPKRYGIYNYGFYTTGLETVVSYSLHAQNPFHFYQQAAIILCTVW